MSTVYSKTAKGQVRDRRHSALSPAMVTALEMLVEQESHGYRNGEGVACSDGSALLDGQAFIQWQTARALERRRLVELDYTLADADSGPAIWLTARGYKASGGAA